MKKKKTTTFFTEGFFQAVKKACQEKGFDAESYLDEQLAAGIKFHDVMVTLSEKFGVPIEYFDENTEVSEEEKKRFQDFWNNEVIPTLKEYEDALANTRRRDA